MAVKINIDSILKRSPIQRVLILVVLCAILAGIGYFLLISPKVDDVARLKSELNSVTAKVKENRTIASDIGRYNKEKAELQAKLAKSLERLPNEKEIPNLIDSISKAVKTSGLEIFLFKPQSEIPRGFYAEVPIKMNVKGEFTSLYDFCYRVSKLPRIVNISGLNVKSIKDGSPPVLEANFVVTTFRFVPEDKRSSEDVGEKGRKGRRRK